MSRRAKKSNQSNNNAVIDFNQYVEKKKKVVLIPRSLNQEEYIEKLLDTKNIILFATGPAGTGKTMLAVLTAIKAYKEGQIKKIVVTRPAVGVDDERHGF